MEQKPFEISAFDDVTDAMDSLAKLKPYDMVLAALNPPSFDCIKLLERFHPMPPKLVFVILVPKVDPMQFGLKLGGQVGLKLIQEKSYTPTSHLVFFDEDPIK